MSKLSLSDIEIIKRDYPVTKVAGQWVKLRKAAQRAFTMSGPCPLHSIDKSAADATSFACNDEEWACVTCSERGDVIRLVALHEGLDPKRDFRKAIDILTGGAPPRQVSAEEARAIEEAKAEQAALRQAEQNEYRDRQQRAAWDVYYKYSIGLLHPDAKVGRDFFALRGLSVPQRIWLRYSPAARFYMPDRPKPRLIHTGPAITAAIQRGGRFVGVHMTFIDLAQPKGKAVIIDPKNGKQQNAKKIRGSHDAGHVDLTGWLKEPHTLVLGEGNEKTVAVWNAMQEGGRDTAGVAFWSALNLGNLGGKALRNVPHPSLRGPTGRPPRPGGPEPDMSAEAIAIPDSVTRLILLGDTTSEPFQTQCVMARAAARYARPGRTVVCAWGPDGRDFDDVLREAT